MQARIRAAQSQAVKDKMSLEIAKDGQVRTAAGQATATQLDEALAAVEESARVPAALWHEALSAGLLSPELSLPAAAPLN